LTGWGADSVSELPEGWIWTSIGSICCTSSGGTPSRKNLNYYGGNIPWLKSGELNDGNISQSEEFITEQGLNNSSAKINNPDTLLIALYGATVGKLGILTIAASTNQAICAITLPDELYTRFIFWYLKSIRRNLLNSRIGGAQPNISQQIIRNLEIPIPPLPEQHRIVAKIEELFTRLDAGVAALTKAKALLKRYRQSVLKAAVEGKLTEEWRKEHAGEIEPASVLLERIQAERKQRLGKSYKPPRPIDTSNLPELPEGWEYGTLANLIYIAGRIGWRGLKAEEYTLDGPLFLSVYNLDNGRIVDFTNAKHISFERYVESPEIMLQDNDILLVKDGSGIGKIGIVKNLSDEATVNSSLLVIRSGYVFQPEFLLFFLMGPDMQSIVLRRITGSATPHLFQRDIKQFILKIPPIEEQKEIVKRLSESLSIIDESEQIIDAELQRAQSLRQSILKRAFAGKLVPQDPNDEPASVLLERIRKEKKI